MPYYKICFNPQISESHLLEEYFILLKPFLERFTKYSYSIEKDNTIQKHLHLIVWSDDPDPSSNFYKKFKTMTFRPFFNKLKNLLTDEKVFLHCQKVKDTPEDFNKTLGYVNKEHSIRRDKKGFTDQEILNAVEYYYTTEHLDKTKPLTGYTYLTTKNVHVMIEQFCEKNDIPIDYPTLKLKMTQNKYSFANIPPKTLSRIFKELRIVHKKSSQSDEQMCNLEADGIDSNYDYETHQNCENLVEFIRTCHSIDPDEVPENITILLKKYIK